MEKLRKPLTYVWCAVLLVLSAMPIVTHLQLFGFDTNFRDIWAIAYLGSCMGAVVFAISGLFRVNYLLGAIAFAIINQVLYVRGLLVSEAQYKATLFSASVIVVAIKTIPTLLLIYWNKRAHRSVEDGNFA